MAEHITDAVDQDALRTKVAGDIDSHMQREYGQVLASADRDVLVESALTAVAEAEARGRRKALVGAATACANAFRRANHGPLTEQVAALIETTLLSLAGQPEGAPPERDATPDEAYEIGWAQGHIDGYREGVEEVRGAQAAADDLVALSQWLDSSNAHRDPEAVAWGRLAKIAEENGEVIEAFIGATGQNPRKGVTHTLDDVLAELLDVAVTALGAYEHLDKHRGNALTALASKIRAVRARIEHSGGNRG